MPCDSLAALFNDCRYRSLRVGDLCLQGLFLPFDALEFIDNFLLDLQRRKRDPELPDLFLADLRISHSACQRFDRFGLIF